VRRSLSVLLLLALLGYPAIVLGSHAAFAQSGYASMLLVAQSPWIDGAGGLALDLRVSGDTTGALIDLQLHKAVDRRGFAAFADGTLSPTLGPAVRLPLADHLNAAGVVSIDLPAGPGTAMATAPGGIYPLVVSLVSTDGTVLDSLHTPLIHLRTGQFTPLRVSFNLEISQVRHRCSPTARCDSTTGRSATSVPWPMPSPTTRRYRSTSDCRRRPSRGWHAPTKSPMHVS